jgi:hypothetical protein
MTREDCVYVLVIWYEHERSHSDLAARILPLVKFALLQPLRMDVGEPVGISEKEVWGKSCRGLAAPWLTRYRCTSSQAQVRHFLLVVVQMRLLAASNHLQAKLLDGRLALPSGL